MSDASTRDGEVVVITGASSGLGLSATKALVSRGYFVVAAVRDVGKMNAVAQEAGISSESYCAMPLELSSLESVREFASSLRSLEKGFDHLICNAAVYLPADPKPSFTKDGFEMSFGVNHLGHFLLVSLLLPDLAPGSRVCVIGSVTGNSNTIAGSLVRPIAEIGELEGLLHGPGAEMVDSPDGPFDGAKAYKDAKALNMMTVRELHRRFHADTGVTFSSMYPGCIAETSLFREKREWFRKLFPVFMKAIGAYVSEEEAGERLAQVIYDPLCAKSGVYWSWNGNAKKLGTAQPKYDPETRKLSIPKPGGAGGAGGEIFENEFAGMIRDDRRAKLAYDYSMDLVKNYT